MKEFLKERLPKFADFLAFYIVTWLMCIFLLAIILPEKFATNPVVTQYTTMASNILSFIVGFYWGGMHKKTDALNTTVKADTVNADKVETVNTNTTNVQP